MNSEEGLTAGFWCIGENREVLSGPHKTRQEAFKSGLTTNCPFAILEVLEPFNNFAWGE